MKLEIALPFVNEKSSQANLPGLPQDKMHRKGILKILASLLRLPGHYSPEALPPQREVTIADGPARLWHPVHPVNPVPVCCRDHLICEGLSADFF